MESEMIKANERYVRIGVMLDEGVFLDRKDDQDTGGGTHRSRK